MSGPFDHGIDTQELALLLAISEESGEMAVEEQERLLEEHEQEEPDDRDDD
ncbi:MAG: hypothetical protein HGA96_05955 [Desulfobulbaceae bacterium]|nr:hypothetical protein [Desulfobulbaceae bacterium]